MNQLIDLWNRIPVKLRSWIKGLEIATVTGVVSGLLTAPWADFNSKGGVAKFAASIVAIAGGCMRLYMAQSPIQNVLLSQEKKVELMPGGRVNVTENYTVSGPDSAAPKL